jgi:hypothetical protein
MLDAVWLLMVLALAAVCLLPHDNRGVHITGIAVALVVVSLSIVKSVRDGQWWMVPICAAVMTAMILLDRRRSTRPDPSRRTGRGVGR